MNTDQILIDIARRLLDLLEAIEHEEIAGTPADSEEIDLVICGICGHNIDHNGYGCVCG